MPRTSDGQGEQTRASLLRSARHEFARRGYHATKVSHIVARSGVTQPTFYAYFPSKEALFAALVAEFRARLRSLVGVVPVRAEMNAAEFEAAVRGALTRLLELLADDPDLTRLACVHAADADEVRADLARLLEANLTAAQACGLVRPDLPAALIADALSAAVERLTLRLLLPGETTPEALASFLTALHLRGVLAERAAPLLSPREEPRQEES